MSFLQQNDDKYLCQSVDDVDVFYEQLWGNFYEFE